MSELSNQTKCRGKTSQAQTTGVIFFDTTLITSTSEQADCQIKPRNTREINGKIRGMLKDNGPSQKPCLTKTKGEARRSLTPENIFQRVIHGVQSPLKRIRFHPSP